jgi:hypothetical protein
MLEEIDFARLSKLRLDLHDADELLVFTSCFDCTANLYKGNLTVDCSLMTRSMIVSAPKTRSLFKFSIGSVTIQPLLMIQLFNKSVSYLNPLNFTQTPFSADS